MTKPQFGAWYAKLPGTKIAWSLYSILLTLVDCVELGYAFSLVNAQKYGDNNIQVNAVM